MGQLKPGSIDDMANSMAEAIDQAMQVAWPAAFGQSLPDQGKRDRQVLFVAIANGVLGYLRDNLAALETTVVHDTVDGHKHHLDFDLG
ncbi:hypothetical protein [Bradyrhizobium iriomotense]|uniref:Uncharacterized protein n=1 Tax=Bradyrhizobium iriomotense TaxID=441950 RepID=A0ABQ6B0N5_9BRAD|nr:hypothetical protein [Bradyrhizobium iriomotense]GLR87957.1 hypothetical protein GCM10007857_46690 [Bradyrhizobium iriomotense]